MAPSEKISRSHLHLAPGVNKNASDANDSAIDSDDECRDGEALLARVPSRASSADVSLVGSYRRPSFAFGQSRPTCVPTSPLPTSVKALTETERETMLEQERELLKDAAGIRDYGSVGMSAAPARIKQPSESSSITPAMVDESTSLLRASTEARWEDAVDAGIIHTTYWREVKVVAKSAPQLYVTFALQYSLTIASIFAAGRLGKDELAGVSLGSMTATITGYAIYQGLTTALDTLCSQAYGAGNKTLVGLHLQRMIFFLMVVSVPIVLLWEFSEPILNALVPEPELVAFASLYLRILALGVPGYAMFEAGKRFVQAQGLFMASTYVLLICAPSNAILNYMLVQRFGYIGAPIAVVITDWLMVLLLALYVRFVKGSECWGGFSRKALYNWSPMIRLAVPGLIMLEAEWLAFEILTLMASYWSTAHVAAQSVLSTTASLTFQLPFALSVAVSTRVANLLGATLGDSAKTTAQLGLMLAAGVGLFNCVLVMATRHQVVRLFSDDPEVIALFVKTIPLGAVFQLFDAIGTCTAGLLRGQGRQHLGSYINLTAYYVLALPLSLFAGFVLNLELLGLWSGVALALFFIAVVEVVIILRTDWNQVVDEAKERVDS
ncbi:mate-domain-containing protein [Sphaerosporella brunnea]|uniref:Mate-domain-containing protein n=1 Tax=Sphaerosporella brunnea TaxID=1250544 RepID=A0A5J5FAT0_9PEZI|nr:mate-domain-containing protein [Sphaerosporella brunnea]